MTCRTLIVRTSLILVYGIVSILVIVTMVEVAEFLEGTVRDLQKNRNIVLAFALTMAVVPSAAMLFWVGKAIEAHFYPPVARVCRFFRTHAQR
jgi:hypothetical protein